MRIVIDLQAVQSTGSRNRGIGRYSLSLALAMVRNRGEHEIFIALNGQFPETIEPIRTVFNGLLPQENIRVWHVVGPVAELNGANAWRRESAELVREAFLASLKPDMVHVSSLFEGLEDDAVTSIGSLSGNIPTAVTLYDLIPYVHRDLYLENQAIETWYLRKVEFLRRADLWLAISESSRREGVGCLGLPDELSINISTDADAHFRPLEVSSRAEKALRSKFGLTRPFVMYTGGIDHRKNIEGLIRGFSKLPAALRRAHQLVIVCSIQPESRRGLEKLVAQQGMSKDEVAFTGFISEDDLLTLYNLCALFVFPSWHEGFGLPALEALRCGAPVIGANTSSLPEVIGWEEALFDPHSDDAIAAAMGRALSDEAFRTELLRLGQEQSRKFSWEKSARRALEAMERFHAEHRPLPQLEKSEGRRRPRLAYIAPLAPVKSGIADYSAELLPDLARLYAIDVIVSQEELADPWIKANCPVRSVQWFIDNADQYERVLYHFGNSVFHRHMFDLLKAVPGVVVLHDFFLSDIVAHMDAPSGSPGCWTRELYNAHGYAALQDRYHCRDRNGVVWRYPCSLDVIQRSLGVIVHSPNSLRLAKQWYGDDVSDWAMIPLLRDSRIDGDKLVARNALGFFPGDFLVCAFGMLGPTKLNHRLLQAWLKSRLALDRACYLLFVGENHHGEYGRDLLKGINHSPAAQNIRITGWVEMDVFRQYLAAADVGVQLRTLSRGETSAAVLDCMNYGLATIVNANGSMSDLDEKAVLKLSDEFSDEQLVAALETLRQDETRRCRMGQAARDIILRHHDPRVCADQYSLAIEKFYRLAASSLPALPAAIAGLQASELGEDTLMRLSEVIARSIPSRKGKRQLLVDISELVQGDGKTTRQRLNHYVLREWLGNPPAGMRVEPVYATVDRGYCYARRFTLGFLGCPDDILQDDPVEYAPGDIFFALDPQPQVVSAHRAFYQALRRQGSKVYFVLNDMLSTIIPVNFHGESADGQGRWFEVVADSDGALCVSKAEADALSAWIETNRSERQRPIKIDWFHLNADADADANADTLLHCLRRFNSFLMVTDS